MPSPVRFAKVRKLLEGKGYRFVRTKGSHHVFIKPGVERPMIIPVHHGKVEPTYVRQIEKL